MGTNLDDCTCWNLHGTETERKLRWQSLSSLFQTSGVLGGRVHVLLHSSALQRYWEKPDKYLNSPSRQVHDLDPTEINTTAYEVPLLRLKNRSVHPYKLLQINQEQLHIRCLNMRTIWCPNRTEHCTNNRGSGQKCKIVHSCFESIHSCYQTISKGPARFHIERGSQEFDHVDNEHSRILCTDIIDLKCRKKKILKMVGSLSRYSYEALEELLSFVSQSKNTRVQSILNNAISKIQKENNVIIFQVYDCSKIHLQAFL